MKRLSRCLKFSPRSNLMYFSRVAQTHFPDTNFLRNGGGPNYTKFWEGIHPASLIDAPLSLIGVRYVASFRNCGASKSKIRPIHIEFGSFNEAMEAIKRSHLRICYVNQQDNGRKPLKCGRRLKPSSRIKAGP